MSRTALKAWRRFGASRIVKGSDEWSLLYKGFLDMAWLFQYNQSMIKMRMFRSVRESWHDSKAVNHVEAARNPCYCKTMLSALTSDK
jgi:hypothetical protein